MCIATNMFLIHQQACNSYIEFQVGYYVAGVNKCHLNLHDFLKFICNVICNFARFHIE